MKAVIIQDDRELIEAISLYFDLLWPGVEIAPAQRGITGVELAAKEHPDIVILDVGLCDIDGFEVCRRIRSVSDVPIVFLTINDREIDKVRALELGADDYIIKPFNSAEFLARIKAVLRRCSLRDFQDDVGELAIGNLWIDFATREVRVAGQEIKLTPTEYELLCLLARNAGRTVPQRVLMDEIWGGEHHAIYKIKVYVQRLRVKLGDDTSPPSLIHCERGVGYRLANVVSDPVPKEAVLV